MAGWLGQGRDKRGLGMCAVTALLQGLGQGVPEWEVEDRQLLQLLTGLCAGVEGGEEEGRDWGTVLREWGEEGGSVEVVVGEGVEVVAREGVEEETEVKERDGEGEEGSEDLDSDDDDLPAFDMSGDTVVTEETKVQ